MKTRNVWFALMLVCMTVGLVSCDDDDVKVDVSWLTGKWVAKEVVPSFDDCVLYYTFSADGTYEHWCSGPTINSFLVRGTYKVNADKGQISLDNNEFDCVENYNIVTQTSEKMEWEKAMSGCSYTYMKLEKCEK